MSVKQIKIIAPGGDISVHVPIESDTTAAEALEAAGLDNDFSLISPDGTKIYQANDQLDPVVHNGDTLYTALRSKVGDGNIPDLWQKFVIGLVLSVCVFLIGLLIYTLIQKVLSSISSALTPPSRPKQSHFAWRQLGWRRSGTDYTGKYRVGVYRLPGRIHFVSKWDHQFEVLAPERLINACGKHRGCFIPLLRSHPQGKRWYKVHFSRRPQSVISGILALQQLLDGGSERL